MNALKLKKLYAKTIKESPYFCDSLLPKHEDIDKIKHLCDCNVNQSRHRRARGEELGNLMWNEVLDNDVWEATRHMAYGETPEAIDALYDAMVTIMRTLDVLEGRQELGRTEDAGNKSDK